jgi:hypothetical protein
MAYNVLGIHEASYYLHLSKFRECRVRRCSGRKYSRISLLLKRSYIMVNWTWSPHGSNYDYNKQIQLNMSLMVLMGHTSLIVVLMNPFVLDLFVV